MRNDERLPRRLYKYRAFNSNTLEMVITDSVYYADPSRFNDPLDTQPSLKLDLDNGALEAILRDFVERRISAEMDAAAKTIKYRGPKTMTHIERHSRRQADQFIKEIRYAAKFPPQGTNEENSILLGHYIKEELLRAIRQRDSIAS